MYKHAVGAGMSPYRKPLVRLHALQYLPTLGGLSHSSFRHRLAEFDVLSSVTLPAEAASLGEGHLSTAGSAELKAAVAAGDGGLAVGEDGRDGKANFALNVQEM